MSEISRVPEADVVTIATLNAQHAKAIAAAKVVDQSTLTKLVLDPKDAAAGASAVQRDRARSSAITPAEAQADCRTWPPFRTAAAAAAEQRPEGGGRRRLRWSARARHLTR